MEHLIKYSSVAKCFEEALPIGNGRLGAMVYGGTECEKISLNEDSAWTGSGKRNSVPKGAYDAYIRARDLVLQDKINEAEEILSSGFHAMWSQIYLPVGNLLIDLGHKNVTNYCRTLDIANAIAATEYEMNGVKYQREVFASHPEDIIAIRLSSDKDGALGFKIGFDTRLAVLEKSFNDNVYISHILCPSNGCGYSFVQDVPFIYTDDRGISLTVAIKVETDGIIHGSSESVEIKGASTATVFVSIKSSFSGWNKDPDRQGLDHKANALEVLYKLDNMSYEQVKKNHIEDYSSLYGRVQLDLGGCSKLDTLSRFEHFDGTDLGLYELLFGYGRYLTISASRQGTQAMNLQGIWNEKYPAPWSSNYTININTEMNYWPTLSTNLEECYEPFLALAKRLRESGAETAREYYHARGFVSHHNTDLWAMTNPVGFKRGPVSCVYAFWNMSAAWIACQVFDLYEYTLSEDKLRDLYPIIEDATLFYSDIIYKDEEGYMICPSTSPENIYLRKAADTSQRSADMNNTDEFSENVKGDGLYLSVSKTTTMTASLLKELFVRFLKASNILGIENELTEKIAFILPQLYPIKTTSDGRIMEWSLEETETDPHHRHVSHLYSLYPGNQITVNDTPELAEACRRSLEVRGDDATGWGLAWKVCLWARLKDGNRALKLLERVLRLASPTDKIGLSGEGGGTFPNMLGAHPPFQIDGNFGSTDAICNMLMQSEVGYIEMLPALPDKWSEGSISGIVAKGNVRITMKWKEGKVCSLTLHSPIAQELKVLVNGSMLTVNLSSSQDCVII